MLVEIRQGTVSQRGQVVLSHFDFEIRGSETIAVVGRNGAGKSTLLQVLAGEKELDRDEKHPEAGLFYARKVRTGLLSQTAVRHPEETVNELIAELEYGAESGTATARNQEKETASVKSGSGAEKIGGSEGGWTGQRESDHQSVLGSAEISTERPQSDLRVRFDKEFTRLGFALTDKERRLGEFSGGQQTKIMLCALLLSEPDILLLDEPTNHLDLETTEWLEERVRAYPGAVVMVSHDRYFLDQTAEVVYEVTGGKLVRYSGNYTAYRQEKAQRYEKQLRAWEAQQQEITRLNDLVNRFKHKPRKAAFARSREKILERMEKIPQPQQDDAVIHTGEILPARPGSRNVLECEHLLIGYDGRALREISVRIRRGQKIGVFGPNGTGKSTFLKTAAGVLPPVKGKLHIGEHIDIAYFDQLSAAIADERDVFHYFQDAFPQLKGEEIHSYLAGFLFRAKDFGKKVSNLSGGEKARLCLAKILMEKPNFLILDEPTNNMDIPAKETIESILRDYKGTILFASHDRYFLSHVADALLLFSPGDGPVMYYPFGYEKYKEREKRVAAGVDVSIARTAEEQRLIEGLRSVPKRDAREHPLSTAEATVDWEYRLNEEERDPAEEAFLRADEETLRYPESEEEYAHFDEIRAAREKAAEAARDAWTKTLLDWYDIWLETH